MQTNPIPDIPQQGARGFELRRIDLVEFPQTRTHARIEALPHGDNADGSARTIPANKTFQQTLLVRGKSLLGRNLAHNIPLAANAGAGAHALPAYLRDDRDRDEKYAHQRHRSQQPGIRVGNYVKQRRIRHVPVPHPFGARVHTRRDNAPEHSPPRRLS